jgi:hypothetical protein
LSGIGERGPHTRGDVLDDPAQGLRLGLARAVLMNPDHVSPHDEQAVLAPLAFD